MTERILSLDPGVSTGWAIGTTDGELLYAGTAEGEEIFNVLLHEEYTRAVCEDFRITERTLRTSRERASLWIIGAFMLACWMRGISITLQTPGDGKAYGTDGKLKKIGWWQLFDTKHARDAGRHLMLYMRDNDFIQAEDLI